MSEVERPTDESEVAAAVRGARGNRLRVRVLGGGTLAVPPGEGEVGVCTTNVSGVVEHRPADLVARVRAGTLVHELEAALAADDRRFPLRVHDPADRATIGGVFAAGADGLSAAAGWRARDLLLGARAVLGNADVVAVGSQVVKSVAGFDVCKALTGSRGTFAVLTEVTFRVEALPEASLVARCESDDEDTITRAVQCADALPLAPRALLVSRTQPGAPMVVIVLLEGPRRAVDGARGPLERAGFRSMDADRTALDDLVAITCRAPADGQTRTPMRWVRGRALDPLPHAPAFVVDVLRERAVAHFDSRSTGGAETASFPLLERVRRAFDPDEVFAQGLGLGAW